jgi:GNAT superfamily N-acetyltransferase
VTEPGHPPAGRWAVERWTVDRVADLAAVCAAALPDEELLAEDLEAACFDDPPVDTGDGRVGPSATFGVAVDGAAVGAVAVALRHLDDFTSAHVQLLAVHPARRRRGIGRALLGAAEAWASENGASVVQLGAAAPFYLFTGVDSRWTAALCLAEDAGYGRVGVELDLICPTGQPAVALALDGTEVRPARSAADVDAVVDFARRCYPHWVPELRRGAEAGTAVLARSVDGAVVGAAAHSVNRAGVIGPVGVDPGRHGGGVGTAMVRALLGDLAVAGYRNAEIAWTSTMRFYALACDARVGRASLQLTRWL